jgi:hypothetical protein
MMQLGLGLALGMMRGVAGGGGVTPWYDPSAFVDYGFAEGKIYAGGVEGNIAAQLTAVRAGTNATAKSKNGNILDFAANTARITDRGLVIEEAWSSEGCNTNLTGVVTGNPGTLPDGMSIDLPAGTLAYSVVATGTYLGVPTFDLAFTGAPDANGTIRIYFVPNNKVAAAGTVRGFTLAHIALANGSLADHGTMALRHVNLTAAFAEIGGSVGVQLVKPDAQLRDYFVPGGSGGGSTAWMRGELQIPVTAGAAVNFTLRLGGLAVVEHNSNFAFGGQLIRSGTAAATRNLDAVTSNVAPPQGAHGGVVEWWALSDACFGPSGAVTALYIGDGTLNNRVVVNLTSANALQVRYLVGNVVVASCELGTTGGQRPGSVAWTLTPTELRASFNGSPQVVAAHASPIPVWSETRFGANPGSIFGACVLKRVTLYNRELTEAELRALAFRDPMNFAICPGDSLSYGWLPEFEVNGQSVRNSLAYPGQLGLARGGGFRQSGQPALSAHCINLGVFGETSTQIRTRLLAVGYDQRAKYCVIWAGQNNVNAPATVVADVEAMVAFCVSMGMDYRVMSPIYRVATTVADRNNIISIRGQQQALYGERWIDPLAIWLPFADPVLDADAIAIGALPNTLQIPDGHPNSRAYEILGQAIDQLLP